MTTKMEQIKDLIEYIVKSIVVKPDKVVIEELAKEDDSNINTIDYHIQCEEEDKGRVIGKEGRVIGSIRSLARIIGSKEGKRIFISID